MHRSFSSFFRGRALRAALVTALLAGAVLVVTVPGLARVFGDSVPAPPANPTSADQIQNVDQVKTAIKAYYGDTLDTTTVDPTDGVKDLHTFSPTSAYADEMGGIAADAEKYLKNPHVSGQAGATPGTKAVLFDVDDTLLNTYSYEIFSNFVYNPTTNAAFVNAGVFPAVPHMVDLEKYAESLGYKVFFLTGRPGTQRTGTDANLTSVGYDVNDSNVYLKDYTADTWLAPCAQTCTTDQYKTLTRQFIESKGYDIVANFGDQFSDLNGGFADRTFKLPNPMYFLP
ncbi:MAG TPA: HAD family acid phosphatase [Gaiellaceae bacterium]